MGAGGRDERGSEEGGTELVGEVELRELQWVYFRAEEKKSRDLGSARSEAGREAKRT